MAAIPAIAEEVDAALAADFELNGSFGLTLFKRLQAKPGGVGVVAAAQAAIGGEDEQDGLFDLGPWLEEGCSAEAPEALKSLTSSATFLVKASAWMARSIALRNRAVAISSIVRVILRMLRTAFRRLTMARVLAMVYFAIFLS